MTLANLILWLTVIINVVLLLFVVFNKGQKQRSQVFLLVALIASWQIIELVNLGWLRHTDWLLISARFGLLPNLFLAPAFIWLVFSLFGKWKNLSFGHKFLWWLPAIVMVPFLFTNYNISSVTVTESGFIFEQGIMYPIFLVYFVAMLGYALYYLVANRQKANLIVKRQINYIFVGTALTALIGLLFSIVLPLLGVNEWFYLGVDGSVFFTIILAYALSCYRFWDLRLSLYKIIIELSVLFVTLLVFYLVFWLLANLVVVDFTQAKEQIIFVLFIGLVSPWLYKLLYRLVNLFLVNPVRDIVTSINNIAEILRSSRDLNLLFSQLAKEISKIVDYQEMFIYLAKHNHPEVFHQVFPVGERLLTMNDSQLLQFLVAKGHLANQAEVDYLNQDKYLAKSMLKHEVDLALPIFYNQKLLGVVVINNGRKLLSRQQLQFLQQINKYLDIAVGSLLLANK
ncbi:GAF domain-containing protein [bacterium]|jgi:hypothetical protein|nr:GAF domain-containing protein [bacterium]MBT4648821.1 GAF domain-containing protein [bacterium]